MRRVLAELNEDMESDGFSFSFLAEKGVPEFWSSAMKAHETLAMQVRSLLVKGLYSLCIISFPIDSLLVCRSLSGMKML